MTSLPSKPSPKRLGLAIDLDTCVGCQACVVSCKQWNTGGYGAPLSDQDPYGVEPSGAWLNRVHGFEIEEPLDLIEMGERRDEEGRIRIQDAGGLTANAPDPGRTVHFPRSCLHCENAACVTVCPTGASYKREEDGIVLVDEDLCIGCGLCAWACPYGARELDRAEGVMKKCTLCIDRIYNEALPEAERQPVCVLSCPANARHFGDFADPESAISKLSAERGGLELAPSLGYAPTNRYLPPRPRAGRNVENGSEALEDASPEGGFLGWLDRVLS